MAAQDLLSIIETISPNAELPALWDERLPASCSIKLGSHKEFLVVQAPSGKFLVSLIDNDSIRSYLIEEFTASSIEGCARALRGNSSSSEPGSAITVQGQACDTQTSLQTPNLRTHESESCNGLARDPNAPPGFVDEHRIMASSQSPRYGLSFDPDSDLYPPGGKYPQLGPLGPIDPSRSTPHTLIGPYGEFRGPSLPPGAGMHPEQFGSNRQPSVRYDPTSPF